MEDESGDGDAEAEEAMRTAEQTVTAVTSTSTLTNAVEKELHSFEIDSSQVGPYLDTCLCPSNAEECVFSAVEDPLAHNAPRNIRQAEVLEINAYLVRQLIRYPVCPASVKGKEIFAIYSITS